MTKKHPKCGYCHKMMIRATARVRKDGDQRPKYNIPYTAIGWYCEECRAMQSGDWLVQSSA